MLQQYKYKMMNRSRTRANHQPTYLIQKYGVQSVQALIQYLQQQIKTSNRQSTLTKSQKLRDQIQYLKSQKARHLEIQRSVVIQHIMECIERQKKAIVEQFEEQNQIQCQQFVEQVARIEEQLDTIHAQQIKQLQVKIDQQLQSFLGKKSQLILQLTYQIKQLCASQRYKQAQQAKSHLQQQILSQNMKKYADWKDHKENKLRALKLKHDKEKNSLRDRLKFLAQQQARNTNQELEKLVKKAELQKSKIYRSLAKATKYKGQLDSLVGSSCILRKSRKSVVSQFTISKQIEKLQEETVPSSQIQTGRWHQ